MEKWFAHVSPFWMGSSSCLFQFSQKLFVCMESLISCSFLYSCIDSVFPHCIGDVFWLSSFLSFFPEILTVIIVPFVVLIVFSGSI